MQPDHAQVQSRSAARLVELAAVVAASLVVSVPFCNKAFHIDDPLYLSIAHQILIDPLRPFDGWINWQQVTEPAWKVSISPPGYSYWLAIWMALGITCEVGLHLAGSFWVLVLGLSTYAWSRRLTRWSLTATLLVLFSPLVIAGQNLMLDVPMLALASSATVIYLYAGDKNCVWAAAGAGALAGLAVNVKYAAIVVIGVMAVDVVLARRWKLLAAPLVAALLVLVGQELTAVDGTPQLVRAREWITQLWPSDWRDKLHRTSTAVLYLGASGPWAVLLFDRWWRWSIESLAVVALSFLGAFGAILDLRRLEPALDFAAGSYAAIFAWNGWLALTWAAIALIRRSLHLCRGFDLREPDAYVNSPLRHGVMLSVWMAGFWYLGSLNGPFVAPRAMLPCVLALVLAASMLLSAGELSRFARVGAVATTAIIGLLVGAGDYVWAGVYRSAAPELARKYTPASGSIYFLGHWGWQHYAEAAGMVPFDPIATRVSPGDVLVIPTNVDLQMLPRSVAARCREIGREPVRVSRIVPLTRHLPSLVFFHGDTRHGRLPWRWSTRPEPIEQFLILECAF